MLDNEQREHSIEIEDLYSDNGNASGTKVRLRIKCGKTLKVFETFKV